MSDHDKLLKIAEILTEFCLFSWIAEDIAKESGCDAFIDYIECVKSTTNDITNTIIEGTEIK